MNKRREIEKRFAKLDTEGWTLLIDGERVEVSLDAMIDALKPEQNAHMRIVWLPPPDMDQRRFDDLLSRAPRGIGKKRQTKSGIEYHEIIWRDPSKSWWRRKIKPFRAWSLHA